MPIPHNTNALLIRTNGCIEPWEVQSDEELGWLLGGEPAWLPLDGGETKHGFGVFLLEDGPALGKPLNQTANLFLMRNDAWPGLDTCLHGDVIIMAWETELGLSSLWDIYHCIPRFGSATSNFTIENDEAPRPMGQASDTGI